MFTWGDEELNQEQSRAVREPDSVFLIACPGSGKTRTLTYKIAYELSRLDSLNSRVGAITYTRRAADEIRDRVDNLGVETNQLSIGTIHSFCLEWIIKPYHIYTPDLAHGFQVIDQYSREKLLEDICHKSKSGITLWDCDYYFDKCGYTLGCEDEQKHDSIHHILKTYFQTLKETRQVDFELILHYAYEIISTHPMVCRILSNLFAILLVDEYQDTKWIQYHILASIIKAGEGRTRVFIVGDPNQAIYDSIGGFAIEAEDFGAMCGIPLVQSTLRQNYRSSNRIIDYFANFNVHQTEIRSASKHQEYSSLVCYDRITISTELGSELVRLILLSIDGHGFSPKEVCILAPQWMLLGGITRKLASALPQFEFDGPGLVPFSRDPENFWYQVSRVVLTQASPEMYIKRLRWAAEIISRLEDIGIDTSTLTPKAFLKLSNSIDCGLETDGLGYLRESFNQISGKLNLDIFAHPLLRDHLGSFFKSSEERIARLRNEGVEYLTDINFFRRVFRERTGITVSTIHGVKGAEFDAVIAFGLLEGMVPHFSNRSDKVARKLLYVVCSRARKNLYLISEKRTHRRGPYVPTPCLARVAFDYDVASF